MKKKIKNQLKKNKVSIIIYLALRILVIISLIVQLSLKNWNNVFLCILTLVLFTIPTFFDKKLDIELPHTLEIIVYLFIYSAAMLGEIQNFYNLFPYWDAVLHTLNGFVAAAVGFSLIDILNHNENFHINMTPAFASLVAFTFSMTIGVAWEFFEFAADRYLEKDMQKDTIVQKVSSVKLNPSGENKPIVIYDINKTVIYTNDNQEYIIDNGYLELGVQDTMKDLFVNFIGATIFSVFGYLYVVNRDEYGFAAKFIMKKKKKKVA